MFDFSNSPFEHIDKIPDTAKVVFVADLFVEDYVGGAELTTQALIDSSPFEVFRLQSRDVTVNLLKQGVDKFWVFGNFTELKSELIPSIVGNLRYAILEYDYKYCKARSPEKHFEISGTPCDCHNQINGKIVSAFYYGAMSLWWMSEKQKERYHTLFPFLAEKDNIILSSVFDDTTLGTIKHLRTTSADTPRKGWIVLGSNSWIKGAPAAKAWCEQNKKEYEVVWNLPYNELLQKLATAEGFVYLPPGGDTCPRMVIEAKLLGCKLQLNDNVQHKDEAWFNTENIQEIEEYLYAARKTFWNGIKHAMNYKPTISGYTTTFNCVKQGYPFEQSIRSMLAFCDEVCVVDGGSTDETLARLAILKYGPRIADPLTGSTLPLVKQVIDQIIEQGFPDTFNEGWTGDSRIKIKVISRDWNHPRFAVFDGMQKAEARAMCTQEFCWQMDSDEVVHEDDTQKIVDLCRSLPKTLDIVSLPVIEYWGGPDKVRMDIQPWKWRLSRNKPHITHGIPVDLRRQDADGNLYAAEGTDGCDMVHAETGERLPHASFYTADVDNVRRVAMLGDENARQQYERWFNEVTNGLPSVFHYSWYDLPRKIRLYRDYWQNHWNCLWNKDTTDTPANNMMFDSPWSQVTDEMIEERAALMKAKLGGWIWHRKWDGESKTPHIKFNRQQPKVMQK